MMLVESIRILLVEDNPGDALLLKEVLKETSVTKFAVTEAQCLAEAVERLGASSFDVVLLDLSLPDSVGLDTVSRIQPVCPSAPIVVLTGLDDELLAFEAVRAGAQDYLVKGQYDTHLLVRSIRYAIERKRFEDALRKSNELLERMFSNIHLLVAYLDTDLNFIRVNRAYAMADGQEPDFFVGKNHFKLYPNEENEGIFRRVLATGEAYVAHEKPFRYSGSPDRGVTYWDWSLQPLTGPDGRPEGLVLSLLDVTERRRLQEEILEISDSERRRIGQDLHDVLGQTLTGMAFLSKVLEQKLATRRVPEAQDAGELSRLANQSIKQSRSLARGLCPVELGADGLMSSLEELAATTENVFDIPCRFECDQPVLIHNNIEATHLYRIAQEAINNAVKHGKPRNIVISLTSGGGDARLRVTDDGVGIPDREAPRDGMGLTIMKHRARTINANVEVRRNSGGGTVVECRFPCFGPTPA